MLGKRDWAVDPLGERRAFPSSPSFDQYTCPRADHMHNFSGNRASIWNRILLFGQWRAGLRPRA